MSVQHHATLNLASLLKLDPELGAEVSGEGEFMPSTELLEADGLRVAVPLHWELTYRPRKGGEVLQLLENNDEDDTLVFSQPEVDFAPLLTQVFAIESPLTVLCKEDCRGLSLDGVNLNDHPEHAPPAQPARSTPSPFASLKDIEL